ncbi:MAG TPA: metallophosphoesterase [Solirubrobacteraceae bacterium]|nr:metallophosphoesterase [Solirubrobacteraceae bacterium]
MSAQVTIVQLTDPHIGAIWSASPAAALQRALDAARAAVGRVPDALLVTGDVASTPTAAEYVAAAQLLAELDTPVLVVPGNHDDRAMLADAFALAPASGGHLSWARRVGPLRVIGVDTMSPGQGGGRLDGERIAWLRAMLAHEPDTPTLLAMHHPPLLTGIPSLDAIAIPAAECAALAEVLTQAPQVRRVTAGHVHRALVGSVGPTPVMTVPSTDVQLAFDLRDPEMRLVAEPPAVAVHMLLGDELVSHLLPVG